MCRGLAVLALLLAALTAVACEGDGGGGAPSDARGDGDVAPQDAAAAPDVLSIARFDGGRFDSAAADGAASDAPDGTAADGGDTVEPTDAPHADAPPLPTLTLEPGTLSFFSLPLGSLRYAVAGWDAQAATCATLIWDYSNTDHAAGAWCDELTPAFPYAIVYPNPTGRCDAWSPTTDLVTLDATGCVDFEDATPASLDLVDVEVLVSGPTFTGRILASNRGRRSPAPVSFGLRVAASAGPIVVQARDEWGLPGWLQVATDDGEPILAFDRCDRKSCGETVAPPCPAPVPEARTLAPGTAAAAVWATWDGRRRVDDADGDCRRRVYAESGAYRATFCYGTRAEADGRVADPACRTVRFAYPTPHVDIRIE